MEVEDGLSRAGADVEDSAVSVFDVALAGDLSGHKMAAPDNFRVARLSFFQSHNMFLGNDEHVRRRLRMDILERENVIVFINLLRWSLAANNAAEKAVGIGHGCSLGPAFA
jgi:hypothetical protein